jgi:broad specificity phosphatase PhoE
MMMRKTCCWLIALAVLAPSAMSLAQAPAASTVVIVRHAEAVPDSGPDPVLSDAGIARAGALAAALKDGGVHAVIATQYQRTMLTGRPVAEAAAIPVTTLSIGGGAAGLDAYVRQVVLRVRAAQAGRTTLIVGHSNTVPALVKAFSGVDIGEIAHDSYDQMFVVTLSAPGSGSLVRARYGP